MDNKKLIRQYLTISFILSVTIALILRFPMIMAIFFRDGNDHHRMNIDVGATRLFIEMGITFIVAFVMFIMNYFILKPTEKHKKLTVKHIVVSVVLTLVLVSFLNHILFDLSTLEETIPQGRGHRNEFDITNFFVSVVVIGCVLIIRLISQKQTYELENEKLRTESLQSQFESLKNQVSPHFLFNSLTAMKTLIRESPDLAGKYVDHLSLVLRYTLQSNEKRLVTLQEEMEFTDSYLFLIKMRYDTNLNIETAIDKTRTNLMLPPLTVQTLVENAIKHNEISKRNPLIIYIKTGSDDTLIVCNRIQEKLTREDGTGIGLSNLSKQYQLLGNRAVQISQENNEFIVEVPLLKS